MSKMEKSISILENFFSNCNEKVSPGICLESLEFKWKNENEEKNQGKLQEPFCILFSKHNAKQLILHIKSNFTEKFTINLSDDISSISFDKLKGTIYIKMKDENLKYPFKELIMKL